MPSQEYEQIRKIGYGSFGSVFLVKRARDNKLLARKDIRTNVDSDVQQRWLRTEIEALRRLEHPNIVQFVHAEPFEERPGWWRIYQEFCDAGSLEQFIEERVLQGGTKPLTGHERELFVWKAALELALALSRCHYGLRWDGDRDRYVCDPCWTPVLHRDIKPANVLLIATTDTGSPLTFSIKLADFGMSKFLEDDERNPSTYGGTKPYWAPEICRELENTGSRRITEWSWASDMWAVGCTLYQLLEGYMPDISITDSEEVPLTFSFAAEHSPDSILPNTRVTKELQDRLRDIIRECLVAEPSSRLNGLELAVLASAGIREFERYSKCMRPQLLRLRDLGGRRTQAALHTTRSGALRQFDEEHKLKAMITALVSLELARDADTEEERKRLHSTMGEMHQKFREATMEREEALQRSFVEAMARQQEALQHKFEDAMVAQEEILRHSFKEAMARQEAALQRSFKDAMARQEETLQHGFKEAMARQEVTLQRGFKEAIARQETLQGGHEPISRQEEIPTAQSYISAKARGGIATQQAMSGDQSTRIETIEKVPDLKAYRRSPASKKSKPMGGFLYPGQEIPRESSSQQNQKDFNSLVGFRRESRPTSRHIPDILEIPRESSSQQNTKVTKFLEDLPREFKPTSRHLPDSQEIPRESSSQQNQKDFNSLVGFRRESRPTSRHIPDILEVPLESSSQQNTKVFKFPEAFSREFEPTSRHPPDSQEIPRESSSQQNQKDFNSLDALRRTHKPTSRALQKLLREMSGE